MRAKTVNEQQDFERGQDPKKAMDLGYQGYEEYIDKKLKGKNEDPKEFWNSFWNTYQDTDSDAVMEEMMEILKNTSLEFQVMWADEKLDWWEELAQYR